LYIVLGFIDSYHMGRQNNMVVGECDKGYSPYSRQEAEGDWEKIQSPLHDTPPVTYFLQLDATS
jgi:hypothetical protein